MNRDIYIESARDTVTGWFHRVDAMLFDAIDNWQRHNGITGDLLEVGCYQGASAVLMGYFRRSTERLVVSDLFDSPAASTENEAERRRWYDDLTRQVFEANYLRFHTELPDIVVGPSSKLFDQGWKRTFRFIHIDGSHEYKTVRSDIRLSRELLVPGGIVACDDVLSRHTPGVTAAVWEAIVKDGLIPLFQFQKMYCTWDHVVEIELPSVLTVEPHEVFGYQMLHVEDWQPTGPQKSPSSSSL